MRPMTLGRDDICHLSARYCNNLCANFRSVNNEVYRFLHRTSGRCVWKVNSTAIYSRCIKSRFECKFYNSDVKRNGLTLVISVRDPNFDFVCSTSCEIWKKTDRYISLLDLISGHYCIIYCNSDIAISCWHTIFNRRP